MWTGRQSRAVIIIALTYYTIMDDALILNSWSAKLIDHPRTKELYYY